MVIVATALGAYVGLLLGFPLFALLEQRTGEITSLIGLSDSFVVLPLIDNSLVGVRLHNRFPAYTVTALFLGATAHELLMPLGASDLGLKSSQVLVGTFGGALGGLAYALATDFALLK